MSYNIEEIQGVGAVYGEKLQAAGVNTVSDLLQKAATRTQRRHLAEATDIDETRILTWVNHADLFRINGIGPMFAELLEMAGVDTVKELRHRNAEHLYDKLEEVNAEKFLVNRIPSLEQVKAMIEEAGSLEPKVEY